VYGYVLETLGKYNSAIQHIRKHPHQPDMTFLYVRIGQISPKASATLIVRWNISIEQQD